MDDKETRMTLEKRVTRLEDWVYKLIKEQYRREESDIALDVVYKHYRDELMEHHMSNSEWWISDDDWLRDEED